MTRRRWTLPLSLTVSMVLEGAGPAAAGVISAPVLNWQRGGCYTSWCETGWYSSPAIVDVDGDGIGEVVASGYSIVALEGADGGLIWRAASGHDVTEPGASNVGRTWPGIAVADLDGDGTLEIVYADFAGKVHAFWLDRTEHGSWPVSVHSAATGAWSTTVNGS